VVAISILQQKYFCTNCLQTALQLISLTGLTADQRLPNQDTGYNMGLQNKKIHKLI